MAIEDVQKREILRTKVFGRVLSRKSVLKKIRGFGAVELDGLEGYSADKSR